MTRSLATELGLLIADLTQWLKNKFFVLDIYREKKDILDNHIVKDKSCTLSAGIVDILMAKPSDMVAIGKTNILSEN